MTSLSPSPERMMQYPVQHSSILMWHIIYNISIYVLNCLLNYSKFVYILYYIYRYIVRYIVLCIYQHFLDQRKDTTLPSPPGVSLGSEVQGRLAQHSLVQHLDLQGQRLRYRRDPKKKPWILLEHLCPWGYIYVISIYIYMHHTIWCITIWYYLSLYDTRLGPMAIRILHIYGKNIWTCYI